MRGKRELMGAAMKVRGWWIELGRGLRIIREWNWP